MKSNVLDVVENTSIVLGVAISLETIYSIMGIILLAFQIGLIVYKVIKSIVKHVKAKEFDKIEEDIEHGISEIQNVVDKDGK